MQANLSFFYLHLQSYGKISFCFLIKILHPHKENNLEILEKFVVFSLVTQGLKDKSIHFKQGSQKISFMKQPKGVLKKYYRSIIL